jgi:TfoX/Sxy family transcriptional regulator of competence genes
MPHDPLFEQRIANALAAHGVKADPKKMFGGVAFMVKGNMSVGITNKGDFMVRFAGERHNEILLWPGAKPMTFGHKNMKGFVFVDAEAVGTKAALDKWLKLSLAYVATLPSKAVKSAPKKNATGAALKNTGGKTRR